MKKYFIILAAMLYLPVALIAQYETERKFSKSVTLSVSADGVMRGDIMNYLKSALQNVKDIVIVDSQANYQIDVVALDTRNRRGEEIGITLSTVILRCFDRGVFEEAGFRQTKKRLERLTAGLSSMEVHKIHVCTPSELEEACKNIIAEFDRDQIERDRKAFRQIIDMLKKYRG